MVSFFALMLWVAAGLAFVAKLPQLGVAIIFVVVFNGIFAFVQEYRAEHAAERIRDLLPKRVNVLRDGARAVIDSADLVREDLVVLDPGDRISADLRLVRGESLRLDASALTGESEPATATEGDALFAGTFVVEGTGTAVVELTGVRTRLAGISELTRATGRPKTPLAHELHRVVRTIAIVSSTIGGAFFVLSLVLGIGVSKGIILAIGITVALVPEGLLPTVTLSLAVGAQQMAHQKALVRRLESVETLGSTTFICTDKTGTLTQNRMSVVEVWTPAGTATIRGEGYEPVADVTADASVQGRIAHTANVAAKCSTGDVVQREGKWIAQGDPMEAAIVVLAHRLGGSEGTESGAPDRQFPFDPRRRRMSMLFGQSLLVKGAPDAVLNLCSNGAEAHQALVDMSERGLRVLAVAERDVGGHIPASIEEAERDLELVGLLGLEDPPRPTVRADIAACRKAGIRLAMVTGDHPATAMAIAREVGLAVAGSPVVEGADLPTDDESLGALVDQDGIVLARISPEQKLRVAHALRGRGHVVAMTGDGVNDGPALQEADIGIAMGATGTDVAREAADLVLLDDNFSTIVEAIKLGRATFFNIRRFLTDHLTDNVAELTPFLIWGLSGGRFPLAIGVLQVLALDIGTDTLPALALGAEPPPPDVLERPPASGRLLDRTVALRAFGVLGPSEALVSIVAFVVSLAASGWRPGLTFPTGTALATASGAAFAAIVLGQVANAFTCRSTTRSPGRVGWFTNRLLLGAVAIELIAAAIFLLVPWIARPMGHQLPSRSGWLVALCAPAVVFAVDAFDKSARRRRQSRRRE
jgi:calcium-translocating P-type ATPase